MRAACRDIDTAEELAEIAARISAAERRAMAAERETVDRLIAHFLAERIGATFEGQISGVTRAGLFVKLDETGADGFIPASTSARTTTAMRKSATRWSGKRTGETFRLGDRVSVKLVEAAPVAGALRFAIMSHGRAERARPRIKGVTTSRSAQQRSREASERREAPAVRKARSIPQARREESEGSPRPGKPMCARRIGGLR